MNTEQQLVLRLMESILTGADPALDDIAAPDWTEAYTLSSDSKLDGVLYQAAARANGEKAPQADLLAMWKNNVMKKSFRQMNADFLTKKLLKALSDENIPYVIFKGVVLSDLYPAAYTRFSVDVDILIPPEFRSAVDDLMIREGFTYYKEHSKEQVDYWNINGVLSVELHTRLWEDYQDEQIEALERMNLTVPGSLISLDTSLGRITTMGHTEHLIYQMFHIIKHMSFMGILLRNFYDTALFINRYLADIDIKLFWRRMEELGYASFCDAMFKTCNAYFGMTRDAMCPALRDVGADTERFLSEIFQLCILKRSNESLNVASMTVYHLFHHSAETKKRMNRLQMWLTLLFPKPSLLASRYAYARKYPVLLPVAWVNRAFYSLFHRKTEASGLRQSIKMADGKLGMLRRFGLMK